jgi:Tfp pilus assembly protein PilW
MDINEYNKRLQGVIDDLKSGAHANLMVQVANDALTMIKDRIINEGKDSTNKKMAGYSTTPILTNRSAMTMSAYNQVAGSKEKRAKLDWVVTDNVTLFVLPRGYKQFRELHGRQTSHVDYTFTGRMWSNIQLRTEKSDLMGGVAVIGAGTDADKKKLTGLANKRGKVLDLTEQEVKDVQKAYDNGILQIFRKNKL